MKAFVDECKNAQVQLEIDVSNCERVSQHAHRVGHTSALRQLLMDLKSPLLRVDTRVTALFQKSNEAEHVDILRWVSQIPYETNHHTACDGRVEGTAEWILTNPTYLEWRSSSASMFLWLHGIRE